MNPYSFLCLLAKDIPVRSKSYNMYILANLSVKSLTTSAGMTQLSDEGATEGIPNTSKHITSFSDLVITNVSPRSGSWLNPCRSDTLVLLNHLNLLYG